MLSQSYVPNYYSLEDILVTQEKVDATVDVTLHGMGFLDPSECKKNLDVGQKIEIPLWYATQFDLTSRTRALKVQIPDIYKKVAKDICEADATAVNLNKMNQFFYEFGRYMTKFDRLNTVGPMIFETCRERCRDIMNLCKAGTSTVSTTMENNTKLENLENSLYQAGCKTTENYRKWLFYDMTTLETASMVSNHQKRKRAVIDIDEFMEHRSKRSCH